MSTRTAHTWYNFHEQCEDCCHPKMLRLKMRISSMNEVWSRAMLQPRPLATVPALRGATSGVANRKLKTECKSSRQKASTCWIRRIADGHVYTYAQV